MSRRERKKGKAGESEAADLIRTEWGIDARRGRQFAGHPDAPDVVSAIENVYIEVKRRERETPRTWLEQAHGDLTLDLVTRGVTVAEPQVPAVLCRRNRSRWMLCLYADDVPAFVAAFSAARAAPAAGRARANRRTRARAARTP